MDITQLTRLEEHGEILNLHSGIPLPLQDPKKIWVVLEGKLDLFLVEKRADDLDGARHHFLRVEAGNPFLGFEEMPTSGFGVIASPAVGSKVLCFQLDKLQSLAASDPGAVLPILDAWVENLGSALANKPAPKNFHALEPGTGLFADGKSFALLPLTGVAWIRHDEGHSHLLDDEQMPPVEPGNFFPVSRAGWLQCTPQAKVECFDTHGWLAADPHWSGLRYFQGQVFAHLVAERQREEQVEKARLRLVAETDANVFESALYKLAEPLRPGGKERLDVKAGTADPLLQVCRLVGDVMGIQFPLKPRTQDILRQRNPLNAIAQSARVRTRQVMLKGDWWNQESGPMVAFFEEDKRPLALLPARGCYKLYDPTTRSQAIVNEEIASKLQGFAYTFYRPFPAKALALQDIALFGLKNCGTDIATIVLMGLAAGFLSIVTPVFTGIIFDTIIPGAERATLAEFTAFLVVSAVATGLFTLTRSLAALRLQSKMEASIQAAVWDRLLALPVPFFRKFTSGDLARRSLGISQIREALTGSVLSSVLTGIFSVISCALMFYYSWRLALISVALVLSSSLIYVFCGWQQLGILREVSARGGRIAGMTLQFINGIAKFRVAGTEARAFSVWAKEFAEQRVEAMRARKISNRVLVFNSAFPVMAWAVIFLAASSLLNTPGVPFLTTGEFLAFVAAFVQFSTGALELSSAVISVLNVIPLYERAQPIFTTLPEVLTTQTTPGELTGKIDLHHVRFRYREDGPLVLRDLSVSVSSGQFVAFVGPSGSGKSTLFRLLLGFETPGSGAVYYDGQDLADLDVQVVRRQIGVVLQNARLMTGSIFRNIVGEGTLTIDDAWDAARLAGLEEDLKTMPMGMHTVVSEGGGGLSGGQRQRLLIARAIVHKPRIILFDEATSALDNHTQAIVSHSLKALNATRIVIAHRLSTVVHADRICVLDKGSIVEAGSYDELMKLGGMFTQLAKRQLS